jgi:ferritin-like metal-binding protein YciE
MKQAHDLFLTGLRNAHALEQQALAMMKPQINRLEHYPEVLTRLQSHERETEGQIRRLDAIFESLGESPSALKGAATSLMGSLGALGHATAGDEILKNTFANFAFENFEIAAYKSLICLAEAAGHPQFLKPLEETLGEEIAMAGWIEENVEAVTLKFVELSEAGETAKV